MIDFTVHDIGSAPEQSKQALQGAEQELGMIPSLLGVLSESPQALEAYQTLAALFSQSSLTILERHVVWLTVSSFHQCHYCVPAHSMMAVLDGVDKTTVESIRDNIKLENNKLEQLRLFTLSLLQQKGRVDALLAQELMKVGFSRQNILDIVLGVVQKVMSNYTNALAATPVDEPFVPYIDMPNREE